MWFLISIPKNHLVIHFDTNDYNKIDFHGKKSLFKESTDSSLNMKKTWVYKIYLLKIAQNVQCVCH